MEGIHNTNMKEASIFDQMPPARGTKVHEMTSPILIFRYIMLATSFILAIFNLSIFDHSFPYCGNLLIASTMIYMLLSIGQHFSSGPRKINLTSLGSCAFLGVLISVLAGLAIDAFPSPSTEVLRSDQSHGAGLPLEVGNHTYHAALALALVSGLAAWLELVLHADRRHRASASHLPHLDELTGAYSRTWVLQELSYMIETNTEGWLILLDIDRFARINNTLGFDTGDKVLRTIARRGSGIPGVRGNCARIGADVFALLFTGDVDIQEMQKLMSVDVEMSCCNRDIAISMCCGSRRVSSEWTAMDILRGAGMALQIAKASGRGGFHICIPDGCKGLLSELDVEIDLRDALSKEQFVIHYQPIVRLEDGALVGYEALLRWQHPKRGLVPPIDFISVLEQTGLIVPVGAWVLREAAAKLQTLQGSAGHGSPLFMSVNVSPAQLRRPEALRSAVRDSVARCGPHLKLEVTESMIIDDPAAAARELASLRKIGVELSLDDFGTGHSSLSVLHRLPFQTLKLDRSILHGLHNQRTQSIIKAVIDMAADLELTVVAEGIEKEGDAIRLVELGCVFGQGYFFGRPCPITDPPPRSLHDA